MANQERNANQKQNQNPSQKGGMGGNRSSESIPQTDKSQRSGGNVDQSQRPQRQERE